MYNKKLLQFSSDYVYGNSVSNASEEDVPVHAKTWYSYSKLISDAYLASILSLNAIHLKFLSTCQFFKVAYKSILSLF